MRDQIITILEDYFRYSIEIIPDEDIPACADDLMKLIPKQEENHE